MIRLRPLQSCVQELQNLKEKAIPYVVGIATPSIVIEGRAFHVLDRDKIEAILNMLKEG